MNSALPVRFAFALALLSLEMACGAPASTSSCSASSCRGCCGADGICMPGATDQACGRGGDTCSPCLASLTCVAGGCRPSTPLGGGSAGGMVAGGGVAGGTLGGGSGGGLNVGGGTSGGTTLGGGSAGGVNVGGGSSGGVTLGGGSAGGMTLGGGAAGGAVLAGGTAVGGGTAGGSVVAGGTGNSGESCHTALFLPLGTLVSGDTRIARNDFSFPDENGCTLTSNSEDLVYEVEAPPASSVTVTATTQAGYDLELNVVEAPWSNCGSLNASGVTTGATCIASASTTDTTEHLSFSNPTASPKRYFVIVDGYQGDSGPFQLRATATLRPAGPTEIEPNDTRVLADATGQALSSGVSMNGTLEVAEADVFKFVVPTAGVLRIETSSFRCSDVATISLQLLDAMGTRLYTGEGFSTVTCRVLIAAVEPGTYYFLLGRTSTGMNPFPYWLSGQLLPPGSGEMEPNNTTGQANLLQGPISTICGSLGTNGDSADVYLFTVSGSADIYAETIESAPMDRCEMNRVPSKLEFLSGAGIVLSTDSTSGRGSCSRLERTVTTGTYFVRVSAAGLVASPFSYCLHVSWR